MGLRPVYRIQFDGIRIGGATAGRAKESNERQDNDTRD